MSTAEAWPTVWLVEPKQERRAISRGAVAYHDAVTRISCLLGSSAAALADNDYITAEQDRRAAFAKMRELSEMIDETEREVCMDEDACEFCGSPSMRRCECEEDF